MQLILASKSPRRREILENLGLPFEVITAEVDETSEERDPCALVEELALKKGRAVYDALASSGRDMSDTVVLSSDTVVAAEGEILGKPRDRKDAQRMLYLLSGRSHSVVSGVALIGCGKTAVSHEVTRVTFDALDADTVARYLDRTEPYDKAGAYAIQGEAAAFISGIAGCYFNVVGLPVHRLCTLWRETFDENLL